MSAIVAIADAVAAELQAGSFSQTFSPKRLYVADFSLKDMKDLQVSVVPAGVSITPASRQASHYEYQVDIGVQQKIDTKDESDADGLMALVEEIRDFFRLRRLVGYQQAVWISTENKPVYSPDHMQEMGQFTSVISLTFRVTK